MNAAVDFAVEQPRGLQDAKVLGDGGERDIERGGEFGDSGFAQRQTRKNGAARGIGEGAEGGIERNIDGRGGGQRIVNHMV